MLNRQWFGSCIALVLLLWNAPGFARGPDVKLGTYPEALKAMAKVLKEQHGEVSLPRLALYDKKGQLLFTQVGHVENLPAVFASQMTQAKPQADATTLPELAEYWVPPPGVEEIKIPAGEFYLVEFWASWCKPCKRVERELEAWLKDVPPSKLVWIGVEEDLKPYLGIP